MQLSVQLSVLSDEKYNVQDIVNNASNANYGSVFHTMVNFCEQESVALQNSLTSQEKLSGMANKDMELPEYESTHIYLADEKKFKQAQKQSEEPSNSEEKSVVLQYENHHVKDTENFTEFLTTQATQASNIVYAYKTSKIAEIEEIKEINDKNNAALLTAHYQKNEVKFNNNTEAKVDFQSNNSHEIEEKIYTLPDKNISISPINKSNSNNNAIGLDTNLPKNLPNKEFSLDTKTDSDAHNHEYTVISHTTTFKPNKSYILQNTPYFSVQTTESISIKPSLSEESSNDAGSFQQENFNYQENSMQETTEKVECCTVKDSAHVQKEQELRMQNKIGSAIFDNEFFEEFYCKENKNFSLDIYPSKEEVVQVKVKFGIKKSSEISISSNIKHNLDMMIKNLDHLRHSLEERGFGSLKFDFHHSNQQEKDDGEILNTKSHVNNKHKKAGTIPTQNVIFDEGLLLDIVV